MKLRRTVLGVIMGVCLLGVLAGGLAGQWQLFGAALVALFAAMAIYSMGHAKLKYYAFTVWVFAFVAASMVYPTAFMTWGGFDLGVLIVPLIQIIMFGMGTTLSLADFGRVFKMPWPVFIGFVAQFMIMPLVGLSLARAFGFPPEIAAGVVLIGCCPSGVASNVMSFLARGDVALSVTITSITTLASPIFTPWLMQNLAGQFVKVEFMKMMLEIINMIIVPIVAGLVANRILYSRHPAFRSPGILAVASAAAIALAVMIGLWVPAAIPFYGGAALPKIGLVLGLALIGLVAMAKLVIDLWLRVGGNWMDKTLPIVSMLAICCIIAVITARSRDKLLDVALLLILSTMIHNALGYLLGYWLARASRLEERACRTVAFEVGMQNGGMASALALKMFSSATALAPAIFGPWQNISGSILATWWHRKPVDGQVAPADELAAVARES